ncbi:MAG: hypothetical protein WD341_15255 [Tistlia sp.]|uniref:CC0125/CC1285 family lipoprotein n=1 Tax=Tistlia sp. TaxID=3057121 RepID=UPI0034A30FDD
MHARLRLPALLALLLSAALAAGCTSPTPYQARGPDGMGPDYGFAEQKLAEDRYRVTATGNEATSSDTLENYLLFRAAELARAHDYAGFEVVKRDLDPLTRHVTHYSGVGQPLGMAFLPGPLYNPGYLGGPREAYSRSITRYRASAEILLLEELPAEPRGDVYDARALMTQLAPSINRPGSLAN